jgi:hypothetical protein
LTKSRRLAWGLFAVVSLLIPNRASAEKILANIDGWQVYSDGRAGAFVSWAHGDGLPPPTTVLIPNADGTFTPAQLQSVVGGGFTGQTTQGLTIDPNLVGGQQIYDQGTIDMWRIRSGFVSNVFGFGVRGPLTPNTTLSAYTQLWAFIENFDRRKAQPNPVDVRIGWAKVEGPWGSVTAGRVRALFSRGATDIDVLYAHRWGVGWPGAIDNNGPTGGQLGFGVLGSGFSGGIMYATPVLGGLQLTVGAFDPVQLQGDGGWTRTKYPREEAELTFERTFRQGWGKLVLFVNDGYQKVYKGGYCTPVFIPQTNSYVPCDQTVEGVGYGGRLELGAFHLGVAGHYGRGLGLNYALEVSSAAQDKLGILRKTTGAYVQTQVSIRKVDVFAGWGIVQVYMTDYDSKYTMQDPRDPTNPNAQVLVWSVLKYQMGINGGIVYNVSPNLHLDLDFFRAEADWFGVNGFAGQKQVVYVSNGGMTVNW